MSKQPRFDPTRPYGEVFGHGLPKFYQNGEYFTGDGQALRCTGPDVYELLDPNARSGEAAPVAGNSLAQGTGAGGSLERENAALRERIAALEARQGGGPILVGTAPIKTTSVPPSPPSPPATYREQLGQLKTAQVKSIFTKAGGPEELAKGGGAQARMIDWLIAREAAASASGTMNPAPASEPPPA